MSEQSTPYMQEPTGISPHHDTPAESKEYQRHELSVPTTTAQQQQPLSLPGVYATSSRSQGNPPAQNTNLSMDKPQSPSAQSVPKRGLPQRTKLFVKNFPRSATSAVLQDVFDKYGNIVEFEIIKDYAFVVSFFSLDFFNDQFLI